MRILDDVKMYARFAWGLRGFLRETLTLEQAKAIVRCRTDQREENFLRLVKKGIYGYADSPYLPLLDIAQVEYGDIETMVRRTGLEDTLGALREAGVYVTFEEFKGREPIIRQGHIMPFRPQNFDNPFLSHYYEARTGGTTGAGTRIAMDLDHMAAQAPNIMLARSAHSILDLPTAIWYDTLPDHTGVGVILRQARFGYVAEKWLSVTITTRDPISSLKNRLAMRYIIGIGRRLGVSIPRPELLTLDQASTLAKWMSTTIQDHGRCLLRTSVSRALRVSLAARELDLDLTGATFMGGSEPPTPAKVRAITSTGGQWVPTYFFGEFGAVGLGCANPADGNDLHLLQDCLALIQAPRAVPGSTQIVPAFYYTSLLATSPKLMLNVESDDYGLIENRPCGCPLEALGLTGHVRHVRSFRKLTGEGVTLVGSDMIHILEEILPGRFGGSPLDYQLLEEEDADGFTRVSLVVHPRIDIRDEEEVIRTVLEALRQTSGAADLAGALWNQAGSLRVRRREPVWTAQGKLMPLHVSAR